MKNILFIVIVLFFIGCSKTIYVPVTSEITKTEYLDKLVHDSIYLSDSILIEKKGDTIFNTRIKYVYKYKLTRDTVSVRDSIYIEKPIEVIKEVNKLTKWQRWRLNFLWVLLAGGIGYLIIKIKRLWK
jgi:hypothetical protein